LEAVLPAEPKATYPCCIKGKRACPPEDCGGPWGYEELLQILGDPAHVGYEDMKAWVESMKEGTFDPRNIRHRKRGQAGSLSPFVSSVDACQDAVRTI